MSNPKVKKSIIEPYLKKFPDFPDLTLAKIIYKENKQLFNGLDACRNAVRYQRGHTGKDSREKLADKTYQKPLTYDTRTFKLPESETKPLEIFKLPKDRKSVLFLTDLHFPHQNNEALMVAINYGLKNKVDTIWLNGDIMDMYQASAHERHPHIAGIEYEIDVVRNFLKELRIFFPKANIYYKEGNHETRWTRFLQRKAPELLGITDFELPIILRFNEIGVHWIPNTTLTKFGKLNVLHGNEFKGGGGVNPARSLYLRAKDNCIAGDKHKSGENTEGSLNGNIVTTWSVGSLCDLNPQYMPMAHVSWNHGFAHITMDGDNFHVKNMRIFANKIL